MYFIYIIKLIFSSYYLWEAILTEDWREREGKTKGLDLS